MDTRSDLSESQLAEAEAANSDNTSSTAFVVKNNEISAQNMLVAKRFDILSDYSFMQSAQDAYEDVLKYAGVSNKRDLVDTRIVNETRTGTYSREDLMVVAMVLLIRRKMLKDGMNTLRYILPK